MALMEILIYMCPFPCLAVLMFCTGRLQWAVSSLVGFFVLVGLTATHYTLCQLLMGPIIEQLPPHRVGKDKNDMPVPQI
jgi:hypothetical protein